METVDAEAAPVPSSCSDCDAKTIKELFQAGVSINRVATLFQDRVSEQDLNRLAREAVSYGGAELSELGTLVLERSKSAARDPEFLSRQMEVLTSDAPDELLDPLFSTLMNDPVVISSGYILDRSTVLDQQGRLKFSCCPFSRAPLKRDVYPLIEKSSKVKEFKQKRLDAMTLTAETLLAEENWEPFDKVIAAAETFLDDIGEETYQHRSRKLAELRLAAAEKPGRVVAPDDMAKIYIRIHRTLQEGDAEAFRKKLSKFEESITQALAEDRVDAAGEWYAAWLVVQKTCKVPPPGLERLGLEVARRRGDDLAAPRRLVLKSLRGDEEAVALFLREEGVDLASLVDRTPFLMRVPRLRSSQADDEWHEALASPELPAPVAMIKVYAGRFVDQRWGNMKTKIALALYDSDMSLVARCNLFGTYRAEGYGHGDEPSRTLLLGEEDVVSRADVGHIYKLEYAVGGGGGHRIEVDEWHCKVYFAGYARNVSAPLRMRGFDDREGDYVGPLDAEGKASGHGELVFSNTETLVGRFDSGELVEGVLWARGEAVGAFHGGSPVGPTPPLLGRFPHDFVLRDAAGEPPPGAAMSASSPTSRSSSGGSYTSDF